MQVTENLADGVNYVLHYDAPNCTKTDTRVAPESLLQNPTAHFRVFRDQSRPFSKPESEIRIHRRQPRKLPQNLLIVSALVSRSSREFNDLLSYLLPVFPGQIDFLIDDQLCDGLAHPRMHRLGFFGPYLEAFFLNDSPDKPPKTE